MPDTESKVEIIKGEIEEKKVTEGVDWIRVAYIVQGRTYATFDTKFHTFKRGDKVNISYTITKDGKYKNIVDIQLIDEDEETSEFKDGIATQKVWDDKDLRMIKMNALTQANSLLATLITLQPDKMREIFKEKKPIDLLLDLAEVIKGFISAGTNLERY